MRDKKKMVALMLVVVFVSAVLFAAYYVVSPGRVMDQAVESVRDNGLEGLRPYLTDNMQEKLDDILFFANIPPVRAILNKAEDCGVTDIVLHNAQKIDWSIEDVKVGMKSAEIELVYRYEDRFEGTAELTMEFQHGQWLISSIDLPLVDNLCRIQSLVTQK